MASKTYNRAPFNVPVPSNNDTKDYFFNHSNWKGVNQDKNFLTVDQETFADAKNVYVDGEGILKSRPAIKRTDDTTKLVNVWDFDDVVVKFNKDGVLSFEQDGTTLLMTSDTNPCLVPYGDKIFVFAKDYKRMDVIDGETVNVFEGCKLLYYDKTRKDLFDATDRIYIPKTKVDSLGVEKDVETANLFTDKSTKIYLYNKDTGISPDVYGKDFTVEMNDKTYSINWDYNSDYTMVESKFKVPNDYFLNEEPMLDVYDDGRMIMYNTVDRSLSYSVTGNSFLPVGFLDITCGDIKGKPKFTRDGRHAVIATGKGFYIITLVPIEGIYEHPNFEKIELFLNPEVISEWDNDATVVFDFFNAADFAYAFSGLISAEDGEILPCTHVVRVTDGDMASYTLTFEDLPGDGVPTAISYNPVCRMGSVAGQEGYIGLILSLPYARTLVTLFPSKEMNTVYGNQGSYGTVTDVKVLSNRMVWASHGSPSAGVPGQYCVVSDITNGELEFTKKYTDSYYAKPPKISVDGNNVLYGDGIYFSADKTFTPLTVASSNDTPIAFTNHIYYLNEYNRLLTGDTDRTFELEYAIDGEHHIPTGFLWSQLSEFYFAIGNNLYISEYREDADGKFMWYFPKRNHHEFDSKVCNLIGISGSEMGVFLQDSLWYVSKVESLYTVTKSKLEFGIKDGGDVMTSYDGTLTMFCTDRGLVALSYQNFVASTEQSLTFLSDAIYDRIKDFVKKPVKLFKHDFWILLYQVDNNDAYIFDTRNGSWWPVSYDKPVSKVFMHHKQISLLAENKLYHIDKDVNAYFDYDSGRKSVIDWFITSQKLHMSAVNYYKHLSNITLSSVISVENPNEPVTYDMDVINYRKTMDDGKTKTIAYKVDMLRTYIQRLNYPKVNEFQYTLRTDHDNRIQRPLSLSNITLKYKITGQVR